MPKDPVFNKLKELFDQLDNITCGKDEFFQNETEKEIYESAFTIAFRKYQGAQYHYNNVLNLYENEKINAIQLAALTRRDSNTSILASLEMTHNADDYAYELSAFLASIKSSLDYLSTALAPHLEGFKDMDSIRTLIKQVRKKGREKSIFGIVKKYLNWLEELREYRHKLIHRTVILTKTSVVIRNIGNRSEIFIHSVFIPKKPPRTILDTRKSQTQFLEDFKDYNFEYSIEENGKIRYNLPKGLSTIEDYMKNYLDFLANFYISCINEILSLGFEVILN